MLTGTELQAKIPSHSGSCVLWKGQSTPSFKWLRVKGYSAKHEHGTRHEVSHLIRYDSLLQNVTDIITKCDNCFITNCDICLLQNASGFLLQNATVLWQNPTVITKCDDFITECDSYYKMRRFYYKMRQLLQNATFITNCGSTHRF